MYGFSDFDDSSGNLFFFPSTKSASLKTSIKQLVNEVTEPAHFSSDGSLSSADEASLRNLAEYLHVKAADLSVGEVRLAHLLHRRGQQIIPASAHYPELVCQRVPDMGMLCKPVPVMINGTKIQGASKTLTEARIAEEIAKQAGMLIAQAAPPTLHPAPSVYQWQSSSTFHFIESKKHYYNVKYADNSALVIKTGEDVVHIGPFSVFTRFGLIEEAMAGRPGADLQGGDGILGFGYSDFLRSASLMKT
eukprot:CAMPEP_0113720042 /NCGR_PEP_ID=MMETSP0038_2-20120614/36211_1 /TAXON_ID=2898 /ORGANISM="Cryptomonas paramecium" /LENGTH=247 /DNA_ID=CAMNT_0000648603 /DNA_START=65 /DNA_END=804 /DNA_ORIENTATION=+ /assembly_acc=CAM_ASM_000170